MPDRTSNTTFRRSSETWTVMTPLRGSGWERTIGFKQSVGSVAEGERFKLERTWFPYYWDFEQGRSINPPWYRKISSGETQSVLGKRSCETFCEPNDSVAYVTR